MNGVQEVPYSASANLSAAEVSGNDTLANVRLWDPTQTGQTYAMPKTAAPTTSSTLWPWTATRSTGWRPRWSWASGRSTTPTCPPRRWVNTTLQYTHGYGMIISPANTATSGGEPQFPVGQVPPTSQAGYPTIIQPAVYFGLNNSGYVVANTKQPEVDYQLSDGTNVETHYAGDGGVQLSNFFDKALFAIRFSDFNLLISNEITDQSRLMFDRGVQARVNKAAPFLSLDADPYPVLVNGQIDWVQDAYTTTANYPYSQDANTTALNPGSGLNQTFNYVRNSVKVLINAYTGKMTFYVMDPSDPIIETYQKAFPECSRRCRR